MFIPAPVYQNIDFKYMQSTLAHANNGKNRKTKTKFCINLNCFLRNIINKTVFLYIILLTKFKGTWIN